MRKKKTSMQWKEMFEKASAVKFVKMVKDLIFTNNTCIDFNLGYVWDIFCSEWKRAFINAAHAYIPWWTKRFWYNRWVTTRNRNGLFSQKSMTELFNLNCFAWGKMKINLIKKTETKVITCGERCDLTGKVDIEINWAVRQTNNYIWLET